MAAARCDRDFVITGRPATGGLSYLRASSINVLSRPVMSPTMWVYVASCGRCAQSLGMVGVVRVHFTAMSDRLSKSICLTNNDVQWCIKASRVGCIYVNFTVHVHFDRVLSDIELLSEDDRGHDDCCGWS